MFICFVNNSFSCKHFFLGAIPRKPNLQEDRDDEDDEISKNTNYDTFESFQSDKVTLDERYKCHTCEAPTCSNPTVCEGAVQCYKSRVRESSGLCLKEKKRVFFC